MQGGKRQSAATETDIKKGNRKGAADMGKRKNRHCQSKREVILRELEKRQQAAENETRAKQMLRTINNVKPAMEQAKKNMRERNRRESRNDTEGIT